jgi:sortase A
MLLGIGGWWGYNQWSNRQFLDQAIQGGLILEPTVDAASQGAAPADDTPALPSPTRTPILSLANLNGTATPALGSNLIPTVTPVPDDSPPIRLTITSVGIDSEIVPVSWSMIPAKGGGIKPEWQVADFAVGHHAGSVNPGQVGNVVLSGHVDYKGEVFRHLNDVQVGDLVTLYTEKGQYIYVITKRVIVKEEGVSEETKRNNARYMDPTPDQTLTMITCWPYGVDDHRFIAIAKPYQPASSDQSEFSVR